MGKAKPTIAAEETQPALFSVELLPTTPQLVTGAKAYVHNGKTTCKDEERAAWIVEAYLECGSLLRVARRFSVSPHTVKAVLAVFEEAGKLDEVKQRLSRKLSIVAELAADAAIEQLLAGNVPPNVLPIMQGVAIDKKALLDGEATARVEVAPAGPLAADDVLTYLKAKGLAAPAIDVQSTVSTPKPQESEAK